jgi:septal ring factor EnvC (AmiA/AmiB activator)
MAHMEDSQPSLGVLLAAIQDLGARVDRRFERVDEQFAQVHTELAEVRRDIAQVRADVLAVKVDAAGVDAHVGDFQRWARQHEADPGAHGRAA